MQATLPETGLSFEYPEDWTLESSDAGDQLPQIAVTSPHTAFLQVSKHPKETELESLFDDALAALRSEYGRIEADRSTESWGDIRPQGYSVNFFCHGLTNTCWVFGLPAEEGNYLALCQAEDREFDRVSDQFRGMLGSIMENLSGDES